MAKCVTRLAAVTAGILCQTNPHTRGIHYNRNPLPDESIAAGILYQRNPIANGESENGPMDKTGEVRHYPTSFVQIADRTGGILEYPLSFVHISDRIKEVACYLRSFVRILPGIHLMR